LSHRDVIEELQSKLPPESIEQEANAAVALLLQLRKGNPEILLAKRVDNLADPWSGQIGLPGGKREPQDLNLIQSVIRETLEETGINLHDNCRFLGVLPALRSKPRPELKILPFVIFLEHEPLIRLNEKELQKSFWMPLDQIEKSRGTTKFASFEAPAFILGETIVWGLTYRILESLLQVLSSINAQKIDDSDPSRYL
jgi:8-oxo-dGTP pyrophosphatase MutT (NUDIX family)